MVAESEQAFSKWAVVYCCLRALEMCEIFTFGKKSIVQDPLSGSGGYIGRGWHEQSQR